MSKLNDVETVETVEGAEATRNGYEGREAVTLNLSHVIAVPKFHSDRHETLRPIAAVLFRDGEIPTVT